MSEPLRILLVDDHALFRRGIREVLEEEGDLRIVAEATDGAAAVRRARELWPGALDLVLMDIEMPGVDGIAATKRLLAEAPGLPVVMLTASINDQDLFAAIQSGAIGFLSKSVTPDAIVRALRDFHRDGALPMSRTMAARVLAHFRQIGTAVSPPAEAEAVIPSLTPREREILVLLTDGARDREIAAHLGIAESTVKEHVRHLLQKLGARNRTEAAARFRRAGR